MEPDIGSESRFLPYPRALDAPVSGVPVGILPYKWLVWKNRMVWLPDGEKFFEDMIICFDIRVRYAVTYVTAYLTRVMYAVVMPK